jgi:hypothetical protein
VHTEPQHNFPGQIKLQDLELGHKRHELQVRKSVKVQKRQRYDGFLPGTLRLHTEPQHNFPGQINYGILNWDIKDMNCELLRCENDGDRVGTSMIQQAIAIVYMMRRYTLINGLFLLKNLVYRKENKIKNIMYLAGLQ